MCGIVGIAGYRDEALLHRMCSSIVHRGPDDNGFHFSDLHSLGMQRLSIIDLAGGHQPMLACDEKVALVFNGEIYNFQEIRDQLEARGHAFSTRSDTEVILRGYLEWGLDVLDRLIGMFAIAISDQRDVPVLYVVRDRFGVKPLYYHLNAGRLTFASELKALLQNRDVPREVNPRALHEYLKLRYVPGEESLLKGVQKLPPGSYFRYRHGELEVRGYWSPEFPERKRNISRREAIDELRSRFETAVRRRLVSDVPVGVFLSGGLDSSVIVANMVRSYQAKVNTFSVGFQSSVDETELAAETARSLGTEHHTILCNDEDFARLERIVWHLDEPIGDAIVLPMYLLAREARRHVKVILAGEGADEVFGGYLFHKTLLAVSRYKRYVPQALKKLTEMTFEMVPHQVIGKFFHYPAALGKDGKDKLLNYLKDVGRLSVGEQYRSLISLFSEVELNGNYTPGWAAGLRASQEYVFDENGCANPLDQILRLQYRDWLADDIMMKLDKMTMAHSLEGREPFLDHELVGFVNSLPNSFKIKGWKDKVILRDYAQTLLPQRTASRTKQPFYIPIDLYFKTPTFRRLFEAFREENYLGDVFDRKYLEDISLGRTSLIQSKQVFSLLILNLWFKQFIHGKAVAT